MASQNALLQHESQFMIKLSSFSSSTQLQSFSPLLQCAVVNVLIKTFPLVHDALAKFFNISNLSLVVDPVLHDSPYRIVDGVKISAIGRPQTWRDEIRRDFSNSTISRALWAGAPSCSKHDWNSCWLLKTVVSTVSENLMPKVHNLYEKVCNVRGQNSCD